MGARVLLIGPPRDDLSSALGDRPVPVETLETGTRESLISAGVSDGDIIVVTDVAECTAIPVALELADVRTVVYTADTVPDFVRGQLDLAVDPGLVDAATLVDALLE